METNPKTTPTYEIEEEVVNLENGLQYTIPSLKGPPPAGLFPFDIWKYSSLPNYNYKPKFLKWKLCKKTSAMLFRSGAVVITGIKKESLIKFFVQKLVNVTSCFFNVELKVVEDSVKIKSIMCKTILPQRHKYSPQFYENVFTTNAPSQGRKWNELSFEPELRPAYYLVRYDSVTFLLFFSVGDKKPTAIVFGKSLSKMEEIYNIIYGLLIRQ